MKRLSIVLVVVLCLLATAVAYGQPKYQIGVSAQLVAHDWSLRAWEGMQEAAEELNVELSLLSAGQDPGRQLADIESFIQRGVDGIIVLLAEVGVIQQGVKKTTEAGIPVVFVDGGYQAPGVIQCISSDNFQIGVDAANWLIEQLGTEFRIILQDYPVLEATALRTKGAKSVFEKYPGIEILEEQPILGPQWTADAQAHAERMLKKYQNNIDVFGICSDLFAIGTASAIDAAGLSDKIYVTGVDGLDQVVEMIASQESSLRLTFKQDSKEMGRIAVRSLVTFLDAGGKIPQPEGQQIVEPVVYVPAIPVTRENAAEYLNK